MKTNFGNIKDSSREDWIKIDESYYQLRDELPKRLMETLRNLQSIQGALPVSRLEHCLQSATLAYLDNRDDQYIFTALFHDVGSYFTHVNHADISAAFIQPYVSEELHWIVLNHEIFESYHYFDKLSMNRNQRDQYIGHPFYHSAVEFCEKYDAPAWDKNFKSKKLEDFYSLIDSVTKNKRR